MNNKLKKGITMASLVIYVVAFSAITVVLSLIYNNMNDTLFFNRGRSINYTALNKLEYNMEYSASLSTDVEVTADSIIYSNGDKYTYYKNEKIIMLNDGIFCTDVTKFEPVLTEGNEAILVRLNITFKKFSNELNKVIVSSVEVN